MMQSRGGRYKFIVWEGGCFDFCGVLAHFSVPKRHNITVLKSRYRLVICRLELTIVILTTFTECCRAVESVCGVRGTERRSGRWLPPTPNTSQADSLSHKWPEVTSRDSLLWYSAHSRPIQGGTTNAAHFTRGVGCNRIRHFGTLFRTPSYEKLVSAAPWCNEESWWLL